LAFLWASRPNVLTGLGVIPFPEAPPLGAEPSAGRGRFFKANDMKQRSDEWRRLRLGDVTASRFGDVLSEPSAAGLFTIEGERGNYWIAYQGQRVDKDRGEKPEGEA